MAKNTIKGDEHVLRIISVLLPNDSNLLGCE